MNSFINSAINIEYVYLILVGVKNFMDVNSSLNTDFGRKYISEKSMEQIGNEEIRIDMKDWKLVIDTNYWNIENRDKVLKNTEIQKQAPRTFDFD